MINSFIQMKKLWVGLFALMVVLQTGKVHAMSSPYASVSGTTVTLSWSPVAGADYYQLQYRNGSGSWSTSGGKYYGSSKTWTGVTYLLNRSYRMRSCNTVCGGWSGSSNAITILPTPATPSLSVPSSANVGQSFTVSAGSVAYGSTYRLYRNGALVSSGSSTGFSQTINSAGSYSYQVSACNLTGNCSGLSGSRGISILSPIPGTPGKPNVSQNGATNTITWGGGAYTSYYNVQVSYNNNAWSDQGNVTSTSKSWSGLNSGSRKYRVRACNGSGCSGFSPISDSVYTEPVPATPSTPVPSLTGNNITVSWNAVTYADYYEISVKFNNNNWSDQGTVTSPTKSWTNLDAGSRVYRVRACNQIGCSSYSPTSTNVVIDPAPGGMSAPVATVNGNDVTLTWTNAQYADYYILQYKDGGGSWINIGGQYTGTSKSWNDTEPFNQRSYRIQACNESGCSDSWSLASNSITVYAKPDDMVTPTIQLSGNNITLSWLPVDTATHYILQYKDGDGAWVDVNHNYEGIERSWLDNPPITRRSYRMKACNQAGCSNNWSGATGEITIDPVPDIPSLPAASVQGGDIRLDWNDVTYADSYDVKVKFNENDWVVLGAVNVSEQEWLNLNDGTRAYQVRACNESGCSAYSASSNSVTILPTPADMIAPTISLADNDVTVAWLSIDHAEDYILQYKSEGNEWLDVNGRYTETNTTWLDVAPVVNQQYRVKACNISACSDNWSPASTVFTINPAPGSMLTPTIALVDNDITLSWLSVDTATYYILQYKDGDGVWVDVNHNYEGIERRWLDNPPLTRRSYRMKACNESGCYENWSEATDEITIDPIPAIPSLPNVSLVGRDITLDWNDVQYADYYEVEVKFNLSDWVNQGTVEVSERVWLDLNDGTRVFHVRACNESGCSEYSTTTEPVSISLDTGSTSEIIIDNKDPNTVSTGNWVVSSLSGYGEDTIYNNGGGTFEWHFDVPHDGDYQVYAWWADYSNRVSNAPYTIHSGDTTTTVTVNQKDPSIGDRWVSIGSYNMLAANTNYVSIVGGKSYTSADAIKVVPVVSSDTEIIVDNLDIGASSTGDWNTSTGLSPYAGNSAYNNNGGTFYWRFNLAEAGQYEVFAWWTHTSSRTANAPFTIYHEGSSTEVVVNQQDESLAGKWVSLGTYPFAAGNAGYVSLLGIANNSNADAIKLIKKPSLTITVELLGVAPSQ